MAPLLEVRNLRTYFYTRNGVVRAVDGISYHVANGETVGIVGESGSGKSVGALSLLRLIEPPHGRIVDGEIIFEGRDLLKADAREMRRIRGGAIAMVFQEPMASLNPVLTIGRQISECLELHAGMRGEDATRRSLELLEMVGIRGGRAKLRSYPHQFSGGMIQRVMIAMALASNPRLIVADEATSSLDVTTQAQILDLVKRLALERGIAVLLITHSLGLVARYVDRVIMMYAGRIVETAPVRELYGAPQHPYTKGLLKAVPRLDQPVGSRLVSVDGLSPDLTGDVPGCAFLPRCNCAIDRCRDVAPALSAVSDQHHVACWAA